VIPVRMERAHTDGGTARAGGFTRNTAHAPPARSHAAGPGGHGRALQCRRSRSTANGEFTANMPLRQGGAARTSSYAAEAAGRPPPNMRPRGSGSGVVPHTRMLPAWRSVLNRRIWGHEVGGPPGQRGVVRGSEWEKAIDSNRRPRRRMRQPAPPPHPRGAHVEDPDAVHVALGQAAAAQLVRRRLVDHKLLQGAQLGRRPRRRCSRRHVAALPRAARARRPRLVRQQVGGLGVVEHRVRRAHEGGVRHAGKAVAVQQVGRHLAQRGLAGGEGASGAAGSQVGAVGATGLVKVPCTAKGQVHPWREPRTSPPPPRPRHAAHAAKPLVRDMPLTSPTRTVGFQPASPRARPM
jgi:hypothetical protein